MMRAARKSAMWMVGLVPLMGCAQTTQAQTLSRSSAPVSAAVREAETLGQAFTEVAERVSPAVVSIRVETRQKMPAMPFRFFGPGPQEGEEEQWGVARGNGSGVVIRASGEILTNNHVVKDATRIDVMLRDGRRLEAKLVGTDEATDLAIVRIQAGDKLPYLSFADPKSVRVGQWVLAVGSPFGLDYTVTTGVVSAIGRGGIGANEIEDYLQTDASINPGNSGGPLVNLRGEVVGINSMIAGRGTGIGFAVPASLAANVVEQILQHGSVRRAWIGVAFQELTPELATRFGLSKRQGALVGSVVPQGPADKAGMQPGDIILRVDGEAVGESADLLRFVLAKRVGQKLTLAVLRDGKERTVQVMTTQRPSQGEDASAAGAAPGKASSAASAMGLDARDLTPELADKLGLKARQGVVVAAVEPGSAADRVGLRRGDRVVEANRKAVQKTEQLQAALADGSALLRIERQNSAFYVVLAK